jgi:selenide,water dikinase
VRDLPRFEDPNLLVGVEDASDAGVYRLRDDLLIVQSVDFFPPLVDDPFVYGQIAAANSLSDVFAAGARPTTAMNIVGFPDKELDLSVLSQILAGGAERVRQAGAVVVGGHSVRDSEIKYGLSVTGVVQPERLLTNRAARPGAALVLTKPLGTGFITTAFKAGRCPEDVLQAAVASMIQLNDGGRDAAHAVGAQAATDITGFGLAGHAIELADASQVTVVLEVGRLPLLPGVEDLARQGNRTRASRTNREFAAARMRVEGTPEELRFELLFDAQTSGGLLLCVPADQAEAAVQDARRRGAVSACVIGCVVERQEVSLVVRSSAERL